MIVHRLWFKTVRNTLGSRKPRVQVWEKEGWFLLGVLPVYLRDRSYKEID